MSLKTSSEYPQVEGIDDAYFQLGEDALSDAERHRALDQLRAYIAVKKPDFSGYQANQALDYATELSEFLDVQLNNIGDPFQTGNFKLNSKWIERQVLDYFAKLWHVPFPHLENRDTHTEEEIGESYWGYVVSMGSTEGNLYGLRNARDYLAGKILASDRYSASIQAHAARSLRSRVRKGRFLPAGALAVRDTRSSRFIDNDNAYAPVLFYSEATHYSIDKIKDILELPVFSEVGERDYPGQSPLGGDWPAKVPTDDDGAIDLDALEALVGFFAAKGHPIVVNFNYGTTFKGAYDNVAEASARLLPILASHGLDERVLEVEVDGQIVHSKRTGYWFHVDGALGAAYGPFLEKAREQNPAIDAPPSFDFRNPIHSIAVSGHKEIGAPWPCGIYITRTRYLLNFVDIGYIGSQDSTLSGSRNGFSALVLWHYLARHSYQAQIDKALHLLDLAALAESKLRALQVELGLELHVHRSPLALSVLFRKPNEAIISRFSLSTDREDDIDYAHLFAMEHVTVAQLDRLIDALRAPDAFPTQTARGLLLNPGSGFR